jgi:hypothetical protein
MDIPTKWRGCWKYSSEPHGVLPGKGYHIWCFWIHPMHADVRWGKIGWSLYSGVLMPRLNQKCRVSVRRGMSLTDQTGGSMESSGDIAAPRYLYLSSFIIANTRQHDGEQNFINVGGGITAAQEHQMVSGTTSQIVDTADLLIDCTATWNS